MGTAIVGLIGNACGEEIVCRPLIIIATRGEDGKPYAATTKNPCAPDGQILTGDGFTGWESAATEEARLNISQSSGSIIVKVDDLAKGSIKEGSYFYRERTTSDSYKNVVWGTGHVFVYFPKDGDPTLSDPLTLMVINRGRDEIPDAEAGEDDPPPPPWGALSESDPKPTATTDSAAYWLVNPNKEVKIHYKPSAGKRFLRWNDPAEKVGASCKVLSQVSSGTVDSEVVTTIGLRDAEICDTEEAGANQVAMDFQVRDGLGAIKAAGAETGPLFKTTVQRDTELHFSADDTQSAPPLVLFDRWDCTGSMTADVLVSNQKDPSLTIIASQDTTCIASFEKAIRIAYPKSGGTVALPDGVTPSCDSNNCSAKWVSSADTTIVATPTGDNNAVKFTGTCSAAGRISAGSIGDGTCTVTFTKECPALGLELTWSDGTRVNDEVPGNLYLGAEIIDVDPSVGTGVLRLQVTGLDPDERPSIVFYELIERATGEQPFASTGEDYADREISTMLPGARANRAEVNADCGTVMVPSIQFRIPSL